MDKVFKHKSEMVGVNTNKTVMTIAYGFLALLIAVVMSSSSVFAATINIITPSNPQGLSSELANGGTAQYVSDVNTPYGSGALLLKTVDSEESVASVVKRNVTGLSLSNVNELSYWSKQSIENVGTGTGNEAAALKLILDMDGTGLYITDFYYNPSYNSVINNSIADIQNNVWQKWDALNEAYWGAPTPLNGTWDPLPELTPGEGGLEGGTAGSARGGGEFYKLSDILRKYPNAQVVGLGLSTGIWYPQSTVLADGLSVNNNVYDFEANIQISKPVTKKDCKKDGWNTFKFKNLGQCVRSVVKK